METRLFIFSNTFPMPIPICDSVRVGYVHMYMCGWLVMNWQSIVK